MAAGQRWLDENLGAARAGTPAVLAPQVARHLRFLESRPGTYTWIPFGGGVHRCIGAGFALTEARLMLQTIAREDSAGEPSRRRTLITMPRRRATLTLVPARA
jgi:cytochrome P450